MNTSTKWLLGIGTSVGLVALLSRKGDEPAMGAALNRLSRLAEGGDEEAMRQLVTELKRRSQLDEYLTSLTPREAQLRFLSMVADQEGWKPAKVPGNLNPIYFHGARLCWNEQSARLFAADCAEHVLHLYEQQYPGDMRPRNAIETARRYARGEATRAELDAAWDAARNAAGDAAGAAVWAAAGDAAWAAVWAAARAAVWDAARDAAWAAGAARAAARDVERQWQLVRLRQYLLGQMEGVEC